MITQATITALATVLVAVTAHAQESIYRSAQVASGQTVRLAVFGSMKPDCTAGPAPEVKVVSPPKTGIVRVSAGKMKTNLKGRCPELQIPVHGVFYQAKPNFVGQDEISFEVTNDAGKKVSQTIKITVTERPASGPQGSGPTNL